VLVRDVGIGPASWSPDGRWIAYEIEYRGTTRNDLYLVHPNGQGRHRVARGSVGGFAWSPDGKRLAFGGCGGVCVMGIDGQGLRRLQLHGVSSIFPTWSPDGRLFLALASSVVWVVRVDGHGLRRVKTLAWRGLGAYSLIGWTRLAPVLPPAAPLLPSEHVLDAETVATRRPVAGLSADGPRVAFVAESTAADCDHVVVWTPAAQALDRFRRPAPCGPEIAAGHIYDVELAGSRSAWADVQGCGNYCDVSLKSATLAEPLPLLVNSENGGGGAGGGEYWDFHVHGHGDLLVFDDGSRLVRIGVGSERCQASICTTLRRGDHAAPVESVSAGLIAIREPDAVAVVDAQGNLVRVFPFPPDDVTAVRLDGGRLVVARLAFLETYDVASGALELSRALPSGYRLEDVDGGIAVLRGGDNRIMLVRLVDGASFMLAPDKAPTFADLESPGLYYSYATPDGGRVVFMPRADVARHLDAGS